MPSHHPSLLLTPQRLLQTFAAALEGSRFIEVIGIVRDAETIEMVRFVRMGDDVGESIPCLALHYKLTFVLRHKPGQQCC